MATKKVVDNKGKANKGARVVRNPKVDNKTGAKRRKKDPNVKVGNVKEVSGTVNVAGRDINQTIQNIQERALTAAEEAEKTRELETKLLAQGVGAVTQDLSNQVNRTSEDNSPYKGLLSYSLSERNIFFGREDAVNNLRSCIDQSSLTILHAESGAGKSSLLQAGIAAQLIESGHLAIYLRPYDTDPVDSIKRFFLPELSQAPELAEASLRKYLRQVSQILGTKVTLYLLLDQFEEFFHFLKRDERQHFLKALADCLNDTSLRVRWILALRAEGLSDMAEFESFGITPFKNIYRLNRLRPDEAREAIEKPAKARKIIFESGLIDEILKDLTKEGDVIPTQLQLVCSALTDKSQGTPLTNKLYTDKGGTEGILRNYLKDQLDNLPANEQDLAKKVLIALISSDLHRTQKTSAEIIDEIKTNSNEKEQINTILGRLIERRLLTIQSTKTEKFELAHDSLVKEIQLDPGELARKAAQELLYQATISYQKNQKLLLTPEQLKVLKPFEKNKDLNISDEAKELLDKSKTRKNAFNAIYITALIAFLILAFWGWGRSVAADSSAKDAQTQAAKANAASTQAVKAQAEAQNQAVIAQAANTKTAQQLKISRAGDLDYQLELLLNKNYRTSLLLGIEAFHSWDTLQSRSSLLTTITSPPGLEQLLTGHIRNVNTVAFSPDGTILASGSEDGTILLRNVATGTIIGQLTVNPAVNSIAFSPDGKIMASGSSDGTINLWDTINKYTSIKQFTGHTTAVDSIVFSPDGKILASAGCGITDSNNSNICSDGEIILWNIETRQQVGELTGDMMGYVTSLAFSPDGKTLASGSYDDTIRLWDVATGTSIGQPLIGHTNVVTSVAFSPDGKILASGSEDGMIRLWNTVNSYETIGNPLNVPQSSQVYSVAFSPDSAILASGSYDGVIRLWDVATGASIGQPLIGHTFYVSSVTFSPDGNTLASGSVDGTVALWHIGKSIGQPIINSGGTLSLAFSPDGKILASDEGNMVDLWDTTNKYTIIKQLTGHTNAIYSIAFSPDGKILASGSLDQTIRLWDTTQKYEPLGDSLKTGWVLNMAFSPNSNMLAFVINNDSIHFLNAAKRELIDASINLKDPTAVAFSPDGKILASASCEKPVPDTIFCDEAKITLWNMNTNQQIGELIGHTDYVKSLAFSSDNKILASGSADKTIRLWNVDTRQPIGQPLTGHTDEVSSVTFSPDGKTLASGSYDDTIRLWDVATGTSIGQPLIGHSDIIYNIAFSPDGMTLATGGRDNIILFNLNPSSWVATACQQAGRNFTRDEWARYFPNEEYRKTCNQWPLEPEITVTPTATP